MSAENTCDLMFVPLTSPESDIIETKWPLILEWQVYYVQLAMYAIYKDIKTHGRTNIFIKCLLW